MVADTSPWVFTAVEYTTFAEAIRFYNTEHDV